jgi:hypothetical protein
VSRAGCEGCETEKKGKPDRQKARQSYKMYLYVYHGRTNGVSSSLRRQHCGIEHGAPPTLFARRRRATVSSAIPFAAYIVVRACPSSSIAAAADPPPPPPPPIPFSPVPRKLTVARVRQSQSSPCPINHENTTRLAVYPVTDSGQSHPSAGRAPLSVNRRAPFRRPTPEPRGRRHGQAQHGHERHWVRMGVRQGEG